jgi:anti-sigma factor (TIGR02949 family)
MTHLNRYTCEEAFRRLDAYIDRELAPDELEQVRAHLEICEGCAREFDFEANLIESVRTRLRDVEVPPGLNASVRDLLARHRGTEGDGGA